MHTSLSRSSSPVHQYKFQGRGSREPCRMRNDRGMWVNSSWLSWLCFELDQVDWIIWGSLGREGQVGTFFEDLQSGFSCVSYACVKKGHKICILVFFKCLADHLWHSQTMQNLAAAETMPATTLPLPPVTVTPIVQRHVSWKPVRVTFKVERECVCVCFYLLILVLFRYV